MVRNVLTEHLGAGWASGPSTHQACTDLGKEVEDKQDLQSKARLPRLPQSRDGAQRAAKRLGADSSPGPRAASTASPQMPESGSRVHPKARGSCSSVQHVSTGPGRNSRVTHYTRRYTVPFHLRGHLSFMHMHLLRALPPTLAGNTSYSVCLPN